METYSSRVTTCIKHDDLTRQIEFTLNSLTWEPGSDDKNKGILIPRYRSEGRMGPDGKIYPRFGGNPDENDKVLVRSIITKSKNDGIVTPDLISTGYNDFTPGAAIGISFSTSITQAITQRSLSL